MMTDKIPQDIWEAATALRNAVNWNSNSSIVIIARALAERSGGQWRPISEADRSIATVQSFPDVSVTLRNSYPVWVRDDDGRVYEAVWSEGHANFWWDLEGESPVDPVEFMPHPLDSRFTTTD